LNVRRITIRYKVLERTCLSRRHERIDRNNLEKKNIKMAEVTAIQPRGTPIHNPERPVDHELIPFNPSTLSVISSRAKSRISKANIQRKAKNDRIRKRDLDVLDNEIYRQQ
jgi:hypothetical protein